MQGSNVFDIKSQYPYPDLNNSIFMSQSQAIRKDRDFDTKSSKNLVGSSSHLHIHNDRIQLITSRRASRHITQLSGREQFNRPLSIKAQGDVKIRMHGQSNDKASHEDFNSHLVKLKVEQMAFKFKSRIGTLLKQISISSSQLNRFTSLARIDDILNFLSQKVKQRLVNSQINENNVSKIRSKQRELISQYQLQVQSLKKRIIQKQAIQKVQKSKIKENHNQLRELYDKINIKEKELSIKMTQLYQVKMLLRQSQRLIQTLQSKTSQLEKQRNELRQIIQGSNININNNNKIIEQQNHQLKAEIQQMKQMLQMSSQKQARLIEFNKNMSQQVARWRQRFQEQRERINEKETYSNPSNDSVNNDKKSTRSMHPHNDAVSSPQDNNKYIIKINELQRQVRLLNEQIKLLRVYKEKYQDNIQISNKNKDSAADYSSIKIQGIKQHSLSINKMETEAYYNKKMQELSAQWRDKLIQMVNNYESQEEKHRQLVQRLEEEKRNLQKKVFVLANEKYMADCKAIQRQAQIYQLTKGNKTSKNIDLLSQQLLISSPQIKQVSQQSNAQIRKQSLKDSKELLSQELILQSEI